MITIKTLMFTSFGKKNSVGSKCFLIMPLNMSTFRISQTFKKKKKKKEDEDENVPQIYYLIYC